MIQVAYSRNFHMTALDTLYIDIDFKNLTV